MIYLVTSLFEDAKNGSKTSMFALLAIAIFAMFIITFIFHLADSTFLNTNKYKVTMIDRGHNPMFVTTSTTVVNNVPITTTTVHPESWFIVVRHNWKEVTCDVYESQHAEYIKNGSATADIAIGRFYGKLYCKGFEQ